MKTSKQLFWTVLAIVLFAAMLTSCAPKKHGCKGLKAHPHYSKNWKH